jgi:hypothetical protein
MFFLKHLAFKILIICLLTMMALGIPYMSNYFVGYDRFTGFPDQGVDTGYKNSPFEFTYKNTKTTPELRFIIPDQIFT